MSAELQKLAILGEAPRLLIQKQDERICSHVNASVVMYLGNIHRRLTHKCWDARTAPTLFRDKRGGTYVQHLPRQFGRVV